MPQVFFDCITALFMVLGAFVLVGTSGLRAASGASALLPTHGRAPCRARGAGAAAPRSLGMGGSAQPPRDCSLCLPARSS